MPPSCAFHFPAGPSAPLPRANYVVASNQSQWILDSGTSHHVTTDLQNLVMHSPYTGIEDIMIADLDSTSVI